MTQQDLFSLDAGRELKGEGMDLAAANRAEALAIARRGAFSAAVRRDDLTADADDAYRALERAGMADCLGNAAGSIFKGAEWRWTGEFRPSERTSNHGRMIRVWRLVGEVAA